MDKKLPSSLNGNGNFFALKHGVYPIKICTGVILLFIKIIRRMLVMSNDAWYIFIRSIQLTAFTLFCAFMLLLECNGSIVEKREIYMAAITLFENGAAILLIGSLFSVLIEDFQSSRK